MNTVVPLTKMQTALIFFSTGMIKNVVTKSTEAYYIPEALLMCSISDTTGIVGGKGSTN